MNPHSHLAAAIDISAHASPSLSLNSLPQSSPPSIHTPGRTRTTPVARSGSLSEQESADGTEVSQMYFDLQPAYLSTPACLEEANFLLGVAYAEREACRASKRLAHYRAKEYNLRAKLYRIRAVKAEEHLRTAEMNVGRVRVVVRKSGFFSAANPSGSNVTNRHQRESNRRDVEAGGLSVRLD